MLHRILGLNDWRWISAVSRRTEAEEPFEVCPVVTVGLRLDIINRTSSDPYVVW